VDRRGFLTITASGLLLPAVGQLFGSPAQAQVLDLTAAKPLAPKRIIFNLPKSPARRIAWTVDDGASLSSLRGFIDQMKQHPDFRLTFFVTSGYSPWRQVARQLAPLVESGQAQLANHTRTHPDLTHLTSAGIARELRDCQHFIQDNFGVNPKPFFRPPFGYYNDYVIRSAAGAGFYTPTMWYGTLGDSGHISSHRIYELGKAWMHDETVLISHANNTAVLSQIDHLRTLLRHRNLSTVTLDDVYLH